MNQYSDFYTYAKGWYQVSSSALEDLRKIVSVYCGSRISEVTDTDIKSVLLMAFHDALLVNGNPQASIDKVVLLASEKGIAGMISGILTTLRFSGNMKDKLRRPTAKVLALAHSQEKINIFFGGLDQASRL